MLSKTFIMGFLIVMTWYGSSFGGAVAAMKPLETQKVQLANTMKEAEILEAHCNVYHIDSACYQLKQVEAQISILKQRIDASEKMRNNSIETGFKGLDHQTENELTGIWASPFGIIALEQDGSHVIGSYFYNEGVIEGVLTGSTLSFRWRDSLKYSGNGSFELQPNGNTLQTAWNPTTVSSIGPWFATRVSDLPNPPGQRSHWVVEMDVMGNSTLAGRAVGSADIFFDNDKIAGRLSGKFIPAGAESVGPVSGGTEDANNIFSSFTGNRVGKRCVLRMKNVQDGSATLVEVTGDGTLYSGTWQDDPVSHSSLGEAPLHGTISLTRQSAGRTETLTEQAWKRHARLWRVAKSIKETWASPLNGDPGLVARRMRNDGDLQGAATAFAKLAQVYRKANDIQRLADTLNEEATTLVWCGRFEEARQRYREILGLPGIYETQKLLAITGLEIVRLSIGGTSPQPLPPADDKSLAHDDPINLKDRAIKAERSGDIDTAVALFDQAIARYEADKKTLTNPVLCRGRNIDIAIVLERSAMAEMGRRRWAEAAARVERAIAVWKSIDSGSINVANSGRLLSGLRLRQGQLPEARASIRDAIAIAGKHHMGETWELYAQAARVEVQGGDYALAETYFQKAIDNIESLRVRLVTDETKVGYFGSILSPADVYEEYVAFLMDRTGNERTALEMAERARARALLDILDPQGVKLGPEYAFVNETPSTKVSNTITADAAVTLARRENTVYLVYFVTNQAAYVWLIVPDGNLYSGRIDTDDVVLRKAVDDLCQVMSLNLPSEEPRRALTHLLCAPVAKELATLQKETRMTIIPHKFLALVPFGALGETSGEWGEKWILTSLPSLSIASQLPQNPIPHQGPLLAVGLSEGPKPLVYSKEEVRQAARLFPGATILLNESATRQRVLAELPRHRVALLSSHTQEEERTVTDWGQGKELELLLAGSDTLSMRDLKRGTLTGMGLVILSACKSIRGQQFSGDELMNLARAFLAAGAERVLITLWPVEDKSSADIISKFLAKIKGGNPAAIALHHTICEYRKQSPRDNNTSQPPMRWAAWVLMGRHE